MVEASNWAQVAGSHRDLGGPSIWGRHSALLREALPLVPLGLFLLLVLAGLLGYGDPRHQNLAMRLQPPAFMDGSWSAPLGTDSLGRDILARLIVASQLSLRIGLIVTALAAFIGITAGLLAGAFGGWIDVAVTGLVELVLSIPVIVIGLVVAATLGQGMTNVIVLLVLTGWIGYARVLRTQTRSLMHADFVQASIAMGATSSRVAIRHVLPNALPQMLVLACQQIAAVMIWEASLTYLGIGLPIERISLGGMIREGQQQVFEAPWIGLVPGIAIAVAVVGFSLLAEVLQRWIDPVQKGSGRNGV